MFIAVSGHFSSSSVGATCDTCRSYGARGSCATWFYKHAALSNVAFASRFRDACAPRENSINGAEHNHKGIWLPPAMCRFPKCHTNER